MSPSCVKIVILPKFSQQLSWNFLNLTYLLFPREVIITWVVSPLTMFVVHPLMIFPKEQFNLNKLHMQALMMLELKRAFQLVRHKLWSVLWESFCNNAADAILNASGATDAWTLCCTRTYKTQIVIHGTKTLFCRGIRYVPNRKLKSSQVQADVLGHKVFI